jgi:hypothetical protein
LISAINTDNTSRKSSFRGLPLFQSEKNNDKNKVEKLSDILCCRLYLTRPFKQLITLLLPLVHIGLTGSVYLTVAVALERYTTVCHPFFKVGSTPSPPPQLPFNQQERFHCKP